MHTARSFLTPRRVGLPLAAAAALTLGAPLVAPVSAEADEDTDVTPARAEGADRYETAATLADLEFDTSHDAFVASGADFPDALAVSYPAGPAGESHGPILLTGPDTVPDATDAALADLEVERVFVVGGQQAVDEQVVDHLEDDGYEVHRLDGADRYETAADLAFGWGETPWGDVGTLDGDPTALLASGADFPDALSAGPIAANAAFPLLLTPPEQAHPEVDATLDDLDIERIVIVGGEQAVDGDLVAHYEDAGYEVERWAGQDRRETATTVADNAIERLGFDPALTLLARGDDYPDALSASVHAGNQAAPMLLSVDPDRLGDEAGTWLEDACPNVEVIRALGGTDAISEDTLDAAVGAAEWCA